MANFKSICQHTVQKFDNKDAKKKQFNNQMDFRKKSNMKKKLRVKPFLPFLFILFVMMIIYTFTNFHPQIWNTLSQFHLTLKDFNTAHPIITPFLFMLIYIVYAILMLPGIVFLSLLSGFLFPQPLSTLYVIISATIGASLLFLAARTAFRVLLTRHSGPLLNRLEDGFRKNASHYMLFLRLTPLFPFKVVNLAGAFFGVSYRIFAWTTFIGMIPSVFIYTEAGKSLSFYLASPVPVSPWSLFDPNLIIALTGLALLSLLPVLIKKMKKERTSGEK